MTPQISVLPSLPLAQNDSGALQPACNKREISAVANVFSNYPSKALRSSVTGGVDMVEYVSIRYFQSDENTAE